MTKKAKRKIDWRGNDGHCFFNPGTVKTVKCGVCGKRMSVERNVFGATSWAESMAHSKHLHDHFRCPNLNRDWHKRIVGLKLEAFDTQSKKIKRILEEEIIEILEANIS